MVWEVCEGLERSVVHSALTIIRFDPRNLGAALRWKPITE
jgi:hypothetical protein